MAFLFLSDKIKQENVLVYLFQRASIANILVL